LAGSILVLAGAAALAASLAGYVRGTVWQHRHAVGDDPILELKGNHPPSLTPGAPFARLSIPRIGLDVIVVEGTRKEDLLKGPGHLVGSADPGAGDNCVIAAHRDLHFRGLDRLVPGDLIRLNSGGKNSEYRVETSRVVSPDDNSVLASSHEALLTLITCYPFRFVGPAPKRYVVRARLAGDSGATL
jgi:sortase A